MSEISLEKTVKFMNMKKEFCGKYVIAKCNGCLSLFIQSWSMKKGGR